MRIFAGIAMALGVLVTLAAGVAIGAFRASATEMDRHWADPDIGSSIYEGVATEGRLWLVGSNGQVVEFDRISGDRRVIAVNVQHMLAQGSHLWALSFRPDGTTFDVRDLRDERLPIRSGETEGDHPLLIGTADGVGVLAEDAVFLPSANGLSRLPLEPPWRGWSVATVGGSGSIYAGVNAGEFGGRLSRIDPRDGSISEIEPVISPDEAGELCQGDFSPGCDPIVGVLPDPHRPECVVAASGQFHLGMTHGKVYRVCGEELTLTYETPNRVLFWYRLIAPTDYWRDLSAPIESFIQTPDGWVAVSTDRYFRMRDGVVSEHRMPDFRHWHGLYISEEQEGVLFLVGACCWGSPLDRRSWIIAVPVIPGR